jgi:hypothetical protein
MYCHFVVDSLRAMVSAGLGGTGHDVGIQRHIVGEPPSHERTHPFPFEAIARLMGAMGLVHVQLLLNTAVTHPYRLFFFV